MGYYLPLDGLAIEALAQRFTFARSKQVQLNSAAEPRASIRAEKTDQSYDVNTPFAISAQMKAQMRCLKRDVEGRAGGGTKRNSHRGQVAVVRTNWDEWQTFQVTCRITRQIRT